MEYTFLVVVKESVTQNRSRLLWPLLLGWLALAVAAVVIALPNEEDDLTERAESALATAGISATVDFNGRDATLDGNLTPGDEERALEIVRNLRGVRQADWETPVQASPTLPPATTTTTAPSGDTTTTAGQASTTTAPGEFDPRLTATLNRGALTLGGAIPSAEAAAQVAGVADLVYGPFVTNDLAVDETHTALP
ncbi:MAG: BON domain-containing protein, partial [Acidimicrobiia bacterium]|nr:BON domain-containing protein [Acidimicrobiia bacterium]